MMLRKTEDGYSVFSGDEALGVVKRIDSWSSRGTSKTWASYRNGRRIAGGFRTRYEAAAFLVNRR